MLFQRSLLWAVMILIFLLHCKGWNWKLSNRPVRTWLGPQEMLIRAGVAQSDPDYSFRRCSVQLPNFNEMNSLHNQIELLACSTYEMLAIVDKECLSWLQTTPVLELLSRTMINPHRTHTSSPYCMLISASADQMKAISTMMDQDVEEKKMFSDMVMQLMGTIVDCDQHDYNLQLNKIANAALSDEETVEWIGSEREVLCSVPRSVIHRHNLLHRGFGAVLFGTDEVSGSNKIFVHQRASTKRLFPSKLDMFVGGVSMSGEEPFQTMLREVKEECGLDIISSHSPQLEAVNLQSALDQAPQHWKVTNSSELAVMMSISSLQQQLLQQQQQYQITYVGEITIRTDYNHCLVDCYQVLVPTHEMSKVSFPDGEIEWGRWMTSIELTGLLADGGVANFVPDGMQVWDAWPAMIRRSMVKT